MGAVPAAVVRAHCLVVAPRLERVAREVQVVAGEPLAEVLGRRPDLDQLVSLPRPAQRHAAVAEDGLDVAGSVRLPGPALDVLVHQPDHRREALGQCLLGVSVGTRAGEDSAGCAGRAGGDACRQHGRNGDEPRPQEVRGSARPVHVGHAEPFRARAYGKRVD